MEYISQIINQIINNFDFSYMFIVNVLTYIIIKIIDYLNGNAKVHKLVKRMCLLISIIFVAIIYKLINYNNNVMEKYSFELKCQVVQDYLNGVGSIAFIANKYSIPAKSNVEKWIDLYNSQGIEVLKTGKERSEYPFSFKKHVVELYLSTKKSYQTLACSFGMKDPSLICKWVKKYQAAGFDALKTRKERVQDFMQEKQVSANKQDNDSDYILKLEEENLKLKIENAYLKELRRLRLEEETLLKKQRELSTASEESSN